MNYNCVRRKIIQGGILKECMYCQSLSVCMYTWTSIHEQHYFAINNSKTNEIIYIYFFLRCTFLQQCMDTRIIQQTMIWYKCLFTILSQTEDKNQYYISKKKIHNKTKLRVILI